MKLKFLLIISILVFAVSSFAIEKEKKLEIIKLKTIDHIKLEKNDGKLEVKANLDNLTPKAQEMGLNDAFLVGSVSQQRLANKSRRITIKWHSVGMDLGVNSTKLKNLKPTLNSKFVTDDNNVIPGTVLSAKGNFEKLADVFLALKKEADKENPLIANVNVEDDDDDEDKKNDNGEYAPTGGTGADSGGGTDASDSTVEPNVVNTSSTWEPCSPRVESSESLVYLQHKNVEINSNTGEAMSEGACIDTGVTVEPIKDYESCDRLVDVNLRLVTEKYQEIATVEGTEIAVNDCRVDETRTYPLEPDYAECGYRHDFTAGESIKLEALYYRTEEGQRIDVTDCQDSSTKYSHYLTDNTCTSNVDVMNQTVIVYKRVAYNTGGTIESYASECAPQAGEFPIVEEWSCPDLYEHDWTNHVSYYMTRYYYETPVDGKKFISECSRSYNYSFPHYYDSTACGYTFDDEIRESTQLSKTLISTSREGIVSIEECDDNGDKIPYASQLSDYIFKDYDVPGSYNYEIMPGVTEVFIDSAGGGGGGAGAKVQSSTMIYSPCGDIAAAHFTPVTIPTPGGGGGSSGQVNEDFLMYVTPGQLIPVIVASGGTGGPASSNSVGGTGGTTQVSILSAFGGTGGSSNTGSSLFYSGGKGASSTYSTAPNGVGTQIVTTINQNPCVDGETVTDNAGNVKTGGVCQSSDLTMAGGGGAASAFGNGGNGGSIKLAIAPTSGERGAGGGGGSGTGGAQLGTCEAQTRNNYRFLSDNNQAGADGADGYARIKWRKVIYERSDGTIYDPYPEQITLPLP